MNIMLVGVILEIIQGWVEHSYVSEVLQIILFFNQLVFKLDFWV